MMINIFNRKNCTVFFSNCQNEMGNGIMIREITVTVHRQAFSELKMPYDTVVTAYFADLECEASAKSVTGTKYEWTVTI